MASIKNKNTKPELIIRHGLHKLGFRYKLHDKKILGCPDLVFPKYNALVFINGCFWHGHSCSLFKWPKSRKDFWQAKILGNQIRDNRNVTTLSENGWRILIIWECSLKGKYSIGANKVINMTAQWLKSDNKSDEICEVL